MTRYYGHLTAAVAHEHTEDMIRAAARAQLANISPEAAGHRTPRRRVPWWPRSTARLAGP